MRLTEPFLRLEKLRTHSVELGRRPSDCADFRLVEKHDVSVKLIAVFRNGDNSQLEDDELDQLAHFVERLAFGDDRARMLAK